MHVIARRLLLFVIHLGPFGLLILGALDSSFLFMPLGNDLLIVALTARNHSMLPVYVLMATAGSVLGCALVDWVSCKGGEKGLKKIIRGRRLAYVESRVRKNAGWALVLAGMMPPPFPFTAFVAAAAALQYPRNRLLGIIAAARLVRYTCLGLLAIVFGRNILRIAGAPLVEAAFGAIVVICIAGSAYSIYSWIRRA